MRRWVRYIFLLIVLLGGAILCAIRWNAWFGNIPEPSYMVPDEPTCVTLLPGEDGVSQRVVTWRAGKDILPSYLYLTDADDSIYVYPATGTIVESRAGYAAYYAVSLDSLQPGQYTYYVSSGEYCSDTCYFYVSAPSDTLRFYLFGDIQEKDTISDFDSLMTELSALPPTSYQMAYLGDVIERPIDDYWQVWYSSMHGLSALVPQIAIPGNHEYLKGIRKRLDSRWEHHFAYPHNGPSHHLGHSYYIDYPSLRLICIDTDGLQHLSDYTTVQTWLAKALYDAGDRWTVVLMHHPVYAAGMGRFNLSIFNAFHLTLRSADLVFAGHDHCYARRAATDRDNFTTPVYVVTSSSSKRYLSSCDARNQRVASDRAFYETIVVTPDSLCVKTRDLPSGEVYDGFTVVRRVDNMPGRNNRFPRLVTVVDSLPAEYIEMPARYEGNNSLWVRRFHNVSRNRIK